MVRGRFDDCCPHCGAKQRMYDKHEAADYACDFGTECHECKQTFWVHVNVVPEFELMASDPDARFRTMITNRTT